MVEQEFRLDLNEILKRNLNYQSEDQISAAKNIKTIYNGQEKVIKFNNEYYSMVAEAKHKSIQG